jgi:hypothetical protein
MGGSVCRAASHYGISRGSNPDIFKKSTNGRHGKRVAIGKHTLARQKKPLTKYFFPLNIFFDSLLKNIYG